MTESNAAIAPYFESSSSLVPVPDGRLARNMSFLAGSQVITWTMTLLWTLVVPRALGPDAMGRVVTALAIAGILQAALGLGTRPYLVRAMATSPSRSPSLIGTAIVLRIGLCIPAFAALVVFAHLARFDASETVIVGLASAGMVLGLFAEPIQASFQAHQRMEYIAYSGIFNTAALSLGGIVLVLIGFRATGLMAWSLLLSGVVLGLNILWLRPHHRIDWRTNAAQVRRLLRKSLVYAPSIIFGMAYILVGSVALAALTPASTVGWYGAANRLFSTLLFFPTIVATAWLPRLVVAHDQGPHRFHAIARAPVELVVIMSLPIAAGTSLIAGGVIGTLYGPAFGPSIVVLMILAASCVPMYFNIIAYHVLVASNRPGVWNRVMVAGTVANVVLNLLAIRYFQAQFGNGAIGAALSLLVTEVLMSAVGVVALKGVLARSSWVRPLKAVAATLGMSVAVLVASPLGFVAQALIGAGVFGGLALLIRLPTVEELGYLRLLVGGMVGRIHLASGRNGGDLGRR